MIESVLPFLPYVADSHNLPVQLFSTCYHYGSFTSSKNALFQEINETLSQFESKLNHSRESFSPVDLFGAECCESTHLFIPHKDVPFVCQECGFLHIPSNLIYSSPLSGMNPSLSGDVFSFLSLREICKEMNSHILTCFTNPTYLEWVWNNGEKGNSLETSILHCCDLLSLCSLDDPYLPAVLSLLQSLLMKLIDLLRVLDATSKEYVFALSVVYTAAESLMKHLARIKNAIYTQQETITVEDTLFDIADTAFDLLYRLVKGIAKISDVTEIPAVSDMMLLLSKRVRFVKQRKTGLTDLSSYWLFSE